MKHKILIPLSVIAVIAGAAAGFAGMVSAQTATTTTNPATGTTVAATVNTTASNIADGETNDDHGGFGRHPGGMGPHIDGNVTAISGTTLTIAEESNEGGTVYTVDASNATVQKNGSTSTLSNVAVGDKIFVQGTATGNTVAATGIMDGRPSGR